MLLLWRRLPLIQAVAEFASRYGRSLALVIAASFLAFYSPPLWAAVGSLSWPQVIRGVLFLLVSPGLFLFIFLVMRSLMDHLAPLGDDVVDWFWTACQVFEPTVCDTSGYKRLTRYLDDHDEELDEAFSMLPLLIGAKLLFPIGVLSAACLGLSLFFAHVAISVFVPASSIAAWAAVPTPLAQTSLSITVTEITFKMAILLAGLSYLILSDPCRVVREWAR